MFSKSCKYALRAVLFLAVYSGDEKKMGVEEIARELNIPKPFLAKILQQLSRHQVISSTKGPNGGFYLNEENRASTLMSVVECIDGKEVFTSCILGLAPCSSKEPCPLHNQVAGYRTKLASVLEKQSVDDFAKRIIKSGLSV